MEMVGSTSSLDHYSQLLYYEETAVIPLKCWQDINLCDIWIPSHLLSSRIKGSNAKGANCGLFHKLEKDDCTKYDESFSIYSNIDVEREEEEIFQSDSDEEHLFSVESNSDSEIKDDIQQVSENVTETICISSSSQVCNDKENLEFHNLHENLISCKERQYLESKISEHVTESTLPVVPITSNHTEFNETFTCVSKEQENGLKVNKTEDKSTSQFPEQENIPSTNKTKDRSDSQFSLNELLDTTPEIDIRNFSFDLKNKKSVNQDFSHVIEKKEESQVKKINKKEKKLKKKAAKYISLDQFLEDGVEEENCFEDFCRNMMLRKNGTSDALSLQDNVEFPGLLSEEPVFIKSEKSEGKSNCEENQGIGLKSLAHILKESFEVKEQNESEGNKTLNTENETTFGKIVLENIPLGTTEEDVRFLFFGYGEIKNFSFKSVGKSFKASVEMDLICDIDWIIECLNGSEPFGASSDTLKCYNATLK